MKIVATVVILLTVISLVSTVPRGPTDTQTSTRKLQDELAHMLSGGPAAAPVPTPRLAPAIPTYSLATAEPAIAITTSQSLSADLFCSSLTVNSGATLQTNGHSIICSGTVNNQGTIQGGSDPSQNYFSSFGGSGGGGQSGLCNAASGSGFSTLVSGGQGVNSGNAGSGGTPSSPSLTGGQIDNWYTSSGGIAQYLAGAAGQSITCAQPNSPGGSGSYGVYIQANQLIAGTINVAGGLGTGTGLGVGLSGGGGGGVIALAYGTGGYSPGSYNVNGGSGVPSADGTVHSGNGGNGQVPSPFYFGNTPPITDGVTVSISPGSPSPITLGQSVTFTASPSGGSGSYTTYTWYWSTTGHSGSTTTSSNTFQFTPQYAGTYTLWVVVTDSNGFTAQSFSVSLTVTSPPMVTFSATGIDSSGSNSAVIYVDSVQYSVSQLPLSFQWTAGSSHSFTWIVTVNPGAQIENVWQSESGCGQSSYTGSITVPSSGCTLSASYSPFYAVTFQVSPSSQGTVSWSGGGNSPGSTTASYVAYYYSASTVSISATTISGSQYSFLSWSSSTSSISISNQGSASTSATINGPGSITGNFAILYTFTLSSTNTGTATVQSSAINGGNAVTVGSGQSQSWTVPYGTTVTITGNPNNGYGFDSWQGTYVTRANPWSPQILGNTMEQATFDPSVCIYVPSGGSVTFSWGSVTPITAQPGFITCGYPPAGSTVNLQATPQSGYVFTGWSNGLTGSQSPTTVVINSPTSITANFVQGCPAPTFSTLTASLPTFSALGVRVDGQAQPGGAACSITSISWTWGDSSSSSALFPATHTYSTSGTYTITATAYQSDLKTATASVTITILPVSIQELNLPSGTSWQATLGSTQQILSTNLIPFYVFPGTYTYQVANAGNYAPLPSQKTVSIQATMTITISYYGYFELNVANATGTYVTRFYVDYQKYQNLLGTNPGPFEAPAIYIFDYVSNPQTYPIYGVEVFQSNQLLPTSAVSTILYQTLVWGYNYYQRATVQSNAQQSYSGIQTIVNNEWVQEAGIGLAQLVDFLSGPLGSALSDYIGRKDGGQLDLMFKLLHDAMDGYPALASDFPNTVCQILTTLQLYGLVPSGIGCGAGTSYSGIALVNNLDAMSPNQYSNLVSDLFIAGAQQTLDGTPQSISVKWLKQLGETVLTAGAVASLDAIEAFVITTLSFKWSIAEASSVATSLGFKTLTKELTDSFAKANLLLFVAGIVNQYSLAQAHLLSQEVDIQNLLAQSIYPDLLDSVNHLVVGNEANVTAAVGTSYLYGISGALNGVWNHVDYQLLSNQIFQSCGGSNWFSDCRQSDMQLDAANEQNYAQFAYQLYNLLATMQGMASSILSTSDPSGVPQITDIPFSLTPFYSQFPLNNVNTFTIVNGTSPATVDLAFNAYSAHFDTVPKLFAFNSTYPLAFAFTNGYNTTVLILFSTPSAIYSAMSQNSAQLNLYNSNSTSVSQTLSSPLKPGQAVSFQTSNPSPTNTQVSVGTGSISFSTTGLPPGNKWAVTLNGTYVSSLGSILNFTNLPNGFYAYQVTAPYYAAFPATGGTALNGNSVATNVNFLPDFYLSSTSACSGTGCAMNATIILNGFQSFSGTITLADTVPPTLTCSAITPSSVTLPPSPASATLTCNASTAGNYTVTITATSGLIVHSTNATFSCSGAGAICTSTVGGKTIPIDRTALLIPFVSLATLLGAVGSTIVFHDRRVRRTRLQKRNLQNVTLDLTTSERG